MRTLSILVVCLGLPSLAALTLATAGCARKAVFSTPPQPSAAKPPPPSPSAQPKQERKEGEEEETVPAAYASLKNPMKMEAPVVAKGRSLFEKHCAACHGPQGKGNGPEAARCQPKPADLTDPAMQKEMTDSAYFWRISEGIPGSAMPSFKRKLTDEERWCLVCCTRALAGAAQ